MAPRVITVEYTELRQVAEAIGQKIALCRKAAGFQRQEDLARALGVSISTVYRWEAGDRIPRLYHQLMLVDILEQTHEFMFGIQRPRIRRVA